MELGEHRGDSSALGGVVVAIPTCFSIHEREQSDRVAWPESTNRLARARADWCDHEAEAVVAQGGGRVECTS